MMARRVDGGGRLKVKKEEVDAVGGMWRGEPVLDSVAEHAAHLRRAARRLASEAGFGSLRDERHAETESEDDRGAHGGNMAAGVRGVSKDGGAHGSQQHVKTPKYNGRADWEAFHAQFELLARAVGWSDDNKALQLALCLTDEALSCLLLLSPAERHDYGALVGALRRRFGQCSQPSVLRSKLSNRQRQVGEPLRVLANDIETLTRRAYAHMPTDVQSELARDQFIRAITPRELRIQTQLAHPLTLQEALELAVEREVVGGVAHGDHGGGNPVVRTVVQDGPDKEKPVWVDELTELIRATALQSPRRSPRSRRGPPGCWVCGRLGHISVHCPKKTDIQGNAPGFV